jgi:sialate O-acetylesterase
MDGCGKLSGAEPPSELVSAFYYDDRWDIAEDPLCWYNEATDPVHWGVLENRQAAIEWDRSMRTIGAGLGIAFGKELVRRLGVPIGLLACSHGGTSMAQWDPALLDRGGESLYGSMIRRVRAAGGRVAGMTWYQGESDANPDAGPVYGEAFTSFVNALRAELDQPEMPVLYVQLGRFYADPTPESERWWHEIREAQRRVEPDIQPAAMVAASDLSLDDIIHVDAPGMRRLGIRMARLAHVVAYGAAEEGWLGPRPTTVDVAEDRQGVTIRFESVNGRLIGTKRLYGFMVRSAEGPLLLGDCRLGGDGLSVELTFPAALPEGAELFYNYGHNPQGVILDGWDMPVPSFGPIAL